MKCLSNMHVVELVEIVRNLVIKNTLNIKFMLTYQIMIYSVIKQTQK